MRADTGEMPLTPGQAIALERDALRIAARVLGELATGPVRAQPELLGSVLDELRALLACESAVAAERVASARGASSLRVLAASGASSARYERGADFAPESGAANEALRTRRPACGVANYGDDLLPAIALPLCSREELLGMLVLSGRAEAFDETDCEALVPFAQAAGDLLLGFRRAALRARAEEDLIRSQRHLRRGAPLDGLTGLANRPSSLRALEDAAARSHAAGLPLAVIVVDIDHAKQLADRVGAAGFDEALARTARAVHDTVRPSDWTGRWGIDSFVLALLGCDADSAAIVAERVRLRVEGASFPVWGGAEVSLTLSAGVASTSLAREEGASVASRALRAVEEAKRAGRNRVCVSRPARA